MVLVRHVARGLHPPSSPQPRGHGGPDSREITGWGMRCRASPGMSGHRLGVSLDVTRLGARDPDIDGTAGWIFSPPQNAVDLVTER